MLCGDGRGAAGDGGEQRRPAEQFLHEDRAHAVRLRDDRREVVGLEVEAVGIELDQAPSTFRVRKRNLDGEVDPPRAFDECPFEDVDASWS